MQEVIGRKMIFASSSRSGGVLNSRISSMAMGSAKSGISIVVVPFSCRFYLSSSFTSMLHTTTLYTTLLGVVPWEGRGCYNWHITQDKQGTGMIRLKVREVAIEKGFSMSRLSREANMAYKTIQTIWRKPDHEVTTTTLDKLSKVLGVTPADLIEYVPDGKEEA